MDGEGEGEPSYRHTALVGQGIVQPMPAATEASFGCVCVVLLNSVGGRGWVH